MYVEELIFDNITEQYDKYSFESKYEYFKLILKTLDTLEMDYYKYDNLKYVKGNGDMWGELNRKIYNSILNYNRDYNLPCGDLAHIINDTLIDIKNICNKKRNKIAIEYLLGYREDKKLSLLKKSDNNLLKKFVYGFLDDENNRIENFQKELEKIRGENNE